MQVAIITDLPFWLSDTMYLDEVQKKLPKLGVTSKVFLVRGSQFFEKADNTTGFIRIMKIAGLLKTLSQFDIIHVQFTFPLGLGFAFLKSLRLLRKPLVIHTHGVDVFSVPSVNYGLRRKTIGRIFTNYTWKEADKIITTCKKAKFEIETTGIKGDKIDVLYNGVDENLFKKDNFEFSSELLTLRKNNDLLFLSVANLYPVKNHIRMLNAFEKVISRYGSKYRLKLLLIGNKTTVSQSKIENSSIIYLGAKNHADVKYFYNLADVFVLPSLSEAHPWSVLEAMSCELPVIASNVGGIPETLEDSRFLVNPFDSDDICSKFESIIEMGLEERQKVGRDNRQRILTHFTLNKHINELKKIYDNVS